MEPSFGVTLSSNATTFACFAPHAYRVEVRIFKQGENEIFPLTCHPSGVWSVTIEKNYVSYGYFFRVWAPECQELVDPYAVQLDPSIGCGKIVDLQPLPKDGFQTPSMADLVISEVHARDILAYTKTSKNLSIFAQLQQFFEQPNTFSDLGVNAIEWMPWMEFDTNSMHAYHWGYMPAHFFAPSSTYGTPQELQRLIQTLHAHGFAVIMDVVYNHAGKKNDLLRWSERECFRHDASGKRTNDSGCGNDIRTEHPMIQRLIIDSLRHWIQTYQVDGFRFDLAELLGLECLRTIEKELRLIKPDVILIAEPWSFRGHIAQALKGSSYACWNDGMREFLWRYVQGQGSCEELLYFLAGSTGAFGATAQQSINYTESHDDYAWVDRLDGEGEAIRRKTHMMFAILLLSLGIPMLAEGQDFLRSKQHVRNTYCRGDLNFLNYEQLQAHASTHAYVRSLIQLRASQWGQLLKIAKPTPGYFRPFYAENSSALCVCWNADGSCGESQLLLALNPHHVSVRFHFHDFPTEAFRAIADTDAFPPKTPLHLSKTWALDPLSCALFIRP
ncbi:MAG: hypothetical protein J6Z25_01655 [Opitutales bacterium]|nr:hypothetical protein [Opitutales bacterium]